MPDDIADDTAERRGGFATRAALLEMLDGLDIATTTIDHPALFTVAQSQELRGEIAGGHSKNLFLKDKKGALFLIVADEAASIEMKSLHKVIGSARLSFGKPDLMEAVLGVSPGSVTPFAAINDSDGRVTIILDEALMAHDVINFHPLENTATTSIRRDDLVIFLKATGHEPLVVAFSGGVVAPSGVTGL
ncbi:MAG: prolyl-tRNA synthetase associated domain-containing protein [Alphaproteobacteria bacterium]